jgi:lysophospholipase L1-like esterase
VLLPLIVALGDSLTSGYGLPYPWSQNYAALYAQHMHGRLVNLAVPGSQCDDVANNEVPKMPAGATIIILNCGSNDIGGFGFTPEQKPDGAKRTAPANDAEMAAAERAFARTLAGIRAKEPRAAIYLVNLRHWQRMTGAESPQFAKDVDAWNAMLARTGVHVVDISSDPRMYQPAYVLGDILHPNAEGNAAIASDFPKVWMQNASPPH